MIKVFAKEESITLSAYNYSVGETYEWSTSSTDATISVSNPGAYWAKVTFGNMCEITDTIIISSISPATVDLGPDTLLCEGNSLVLDANQTDPTVEYLWQDGSTASTLTVVSPGSYYIDINKSGCSFHGFYIN